MVLFRKTILVSVVLLFAVSMFPAHTRSDSSMYQRCRVGVDCELGEYVFDNDGNPVTSQVCTIDIRNPSGSLIVDDGAMTAESDGWHHYTANYSSPIGLYRTVIYCDNSGDDGYLDKSFYLGISFEEISSEVSALLAIDAKIDILLANWGSYDASNIYETVTEVSEEIATLNTVLDLAPLLDSSTVTEGNTKEIMNAVLAMRAVVDVNRTLLETVSNKPVIQTWLEEGSIVFKTLILNPSSLAEQEVPLKYYLPKEISCEDIIEVDEGLIVEYDTSQEAFYVSGDFSLDPGETKILTVEVDDIWVISEDEVKSLREHSEELFEPLEDTAYYSQGSLVKSDIDASLDKVLRLKEEATTPQSRIIAYREANAELAIVYGKIETLESLVASAGSMDTMFGFIGGAQTFGTWGMIIALVAGFVFLALYFRSLILRISGPEKVAPSGEMESGDSRKEVLRPIDIVILIAIIVTIVLLIVFIFKRNGENEDSPGDTSVSGSEDVESEESEKTLQDTEEIDVVEEDQVLGAQSGVETIRVVVPETAAVYVRDSASKNATVIHQIAATSEFHKLDESGTWVQVEIELDDGFTYIKGWIAEEYIEILPQ